MLNYESKSQPQLQKLKKSMDQMKIHIQKGYPREIIF